MKIKYEFQHLLDTLKFEIKKINSYLAHWKL